MFTIPSSITNHMTLEQVINSIKTHELVAGIVVAGSSGRDELKPESDYDIVVVLYDYPHPMHVILTTIDGRMTDIAFWHVEQLNSMLAMDSVQGNIAESAVFNWIHTGIIYHDETGKLEQIKHHHPEIVVDNDKRVLFNLWYSINFNLHHGERMLQSDDEVYLLAMDFRYLYMLLEVLDAYMLCRNIPQRGEKATIRYLKVHAPTDLALYTSILHQSDRHQKFRLYKQFAQLALAPIGGVWGSTNVTAFNLHQNLPLENHDKLFDFWQDLLQSS